MGNCYYARCNNCELAVFAEIDLRDLTANKYMENVNIKCFIVSIFVNICVWLFATITCLLNEKRKRTSEAKGCTFAHFPLNM